MSRQVVNWEVLIARQRQLNDAIVASGLFDDDIATTTYPPAPESEITAAEERLGVHLDPHYRELLLTTNGWRHLYRWQNLLPAGDLGADIHNDDEILPWHFVEEEHRAFWTSGDPANDPEGYPGYQRLLPIGVKDPGIGGLLVIAAVPATEPAPTTPGVVFDTSDDPLVTYPNLAAYIQARSDDDYQLLQSYGISI
ncbi:SMI1/KNR4 family protein [uncultured Gordonia sp.]|uniref:SMI1/KNR4 family protein n=1 Tax=uncultured Gordonia sp. TaxID=198437 RepID=UPI00258930D0|nr:SMI1/KNR4 family protein [uncultured Gordonia sp.]